MNFKDLFSQRSQDYAKFRPTYPKKLFQYLSGITPEHELAWDVGTGSGQAAIQLAEFFKNVVATDPSQAQLEAATPKIGVQYLQATAEKSPLHEKTADLITSAQAFHWFKQESFFREVARVGKKGSVLAFWCYGLAEIDPSIDSLVLKLYRDVLDSYWEPERQGVEDGYRSVILPFEEIPSPQFKMEAQWNLENLLGYLSTWSALKTYLKKNSSEEVERIFEELGKVWGGREKVQVLWKIHLRVARL